MSEVPRGLSRFSLPDLEALLRNVERGKVDCPLTESGLSAAGYGEHGNELVATLDGADKAGVRAAIRIAIAERVYRPPPRLDVVWTGPEARHASARDTAIVVRQLFASARESVLVGGFRFDHGADLLRPLHEGMRDHNVSATFFLDIDERATTAADAEDAAIKSIDRFFVSNWPFGEPRPDIYFDPRTAAPGPPWASLHAKCVIVDERHTFITSANFTDRGQTRNIEIGVLIDDEGFACDVIAHWRGLIRAGLVLRYRG